MLSLTARRMPRLMRALMTLALAAPMVLFFAGCGGGGGVNEKNYDKVNPGMTEAEVEKVLGKPSNKSPDRDFATTIPPGGKAVVYLNKEGDKSITVIYVGGKMTDKTQSGF
jgi:SmpA/OmlA family protein